MSTKRWFPPTYLSYWGKYDPKSGAWHPAAYHCIDVAAVMIQILENSRWSCCDFTPLEYACLLGSAATHDVLKLHHLFQAKLMDVAFECYPPFSERSLNSRQIHKLKEGSKLFWHNVMAVYYAMREKWPKQLRGNIERIKEQAGHHGVPYRSYMLDSGHPNGIKPNAMALDSSLFFRFVEYDKVARAEFMRDTSDMFLRGFRRRKAPPLGKTALGLLCVCDWLASTEEFFSYVREPMPLADYLKMRMPCAKEAVRASGLEPRKVIGCGWDALYPDLTPHVFQKKFNAIKIPNEPTICLVEAGGGDGKTACAMAGASRISEKNGGSNIIFCCPTMSAANNTYAEVVKIAPKIFGPDATACLSHSRAHINPLAKRLSGAVRPTDEHGEPLAAKTWWLGSDRRLACFADVCVCTIDFLALSILPTRHREVRQLPLHRAVLVVDEIHSYDPYLLECTKIAMRRVYESGGSVILLSATLPNSIRADLVGAFYGHPVKCYVSSRETRYPLISVIRQKKAMGLEGVECRRRVVNGKSRKVYDVKKSVKVKVFRADRMIPTDDVFEDVAKRASSGQKVVIFCNMVAHAQYVYERLSDMVSKSTKKKLAHARYFPEHRYANDEWLLNNCGRGLPFGKGLIVVATQVAEEALNLDFDYLVAQLCPVDVLLQRLGRLWRTPTEGRTEALGRAAECLIILPPDPDNVKSYGLHKLIYEDVSILWRTARLLDPRNDGTGKKTVITFPRGYRKLMRMVYDEDFQIRGLPPEIAEYARRHDSAALDRILANRRSMMDANDVILNDKKMEELMTRLGRYDREIHIVLPPVAGEIFYRVPYKHGRRLYHPAAVDKMEDALIKRGLPAPQRVQRMRENRNRCLRDLDYCCVRVADHWHSDLVKDFRDGVCYVVAEQRGDMLHMCGQKHHYTYCPTFGIRRR